MCYKVITESKRSHSYILAENLKHPQKDYYKVCTLTFFETYNSMGSQVSVFHSLITTVCLLDWTQTKDSGLEDEIVVC